MEEDVRMAHGVSLWGLLLPLLLPAAQITVEPNPILAGEETIKSLGSY